LIEDRLTNDAQRVDSLRVRHRPGAARAVIRVVAEAVHHAILTARFLINQGNDFAHAGHYQARRTEELYDFA